MDEITQKLLNALKSEEFEFINDFLIDISSNLNQQDLKYVDLLLNARNQDLWKNFLINLIYYLGELGNKYTLNEKYITFMKKSYFQSDRWVRNEILSSVLKFVDKIESKDDVLLIVNNGISDEYSPIKLNSLKILNCLDSIPEEIMIKIFLILPSENSEIITVAFQVIKKNIHSNRSLIRILEKMSEIKLKIELTLLRNILTNLFLSVMQLEQFREDLLNSDLVEDIKQSLLKEIAIMQKILLQNPSR